jgi:nucleotide-binding universal stress UspA family protein
MTYRNILVLVDQSGASRTRVAAAIDIARRFGASLTGVFLKSELIPAFFAGDAFSAVTAVESFVENRKHVIAGASAAARGQFETAVRNVGLPFNWAEINGDDDLAIIACARRFDLSILPRAMQAAGGVYTVEASRVAMANGGPVLILPELGYPVPFGRKILVAWKESRESARALRDAWPFLSMAEEVHFVTVSPDATPEFDGFQQFNLNAHGCQSAKLIVDRNDDVATGDTIALRAGMVGADMIVLGLYGHSRLQEVLLGGVSREMLGALELPLLVSH